MFARSLLLFAVTLCASFLSARVTWICGEGFPVDPRAVASELAILLDETVELIHTDVKYLSVWANDPETEEDRLRLLTTEHLIVTLPANEPLPLATLGLDAIATQRGVHYDKPVLVAAQKPVYQMRGLCNNKTLQQTARVAMGANFDFLALPKVWQQVYTDDTFYNDRVLKGIASEAYVFAAGIAFTLKGDEFELPFLPGVHEEVAEDLIDSILEGKALTEDVLYAARYLSVGAYNLRVGKRFSAVLYDGAFERAIGEWLMRLAEADGRQLTLHYTTDTALDTGVPGLFRTTNPLGNAPKVCTYTRPAFKDDSGLTELDHLNDIIKADVKKQHWMPFPLAVAEWTRRLTGNPVYEGVKPTSAAAAMFAAMLYLEWTGSAVLPTDADQIETVAIGIGLDIMLRMRLQRAEVNAIFCRPTDAQTYTFSLWRAPKEKVTLRLSTDDPKRKVTPASLTFTPENYWSRQPVKVDGPCTLLWKISASDFPGQNTGARVVE